MPISIFTYDQLGQGVNRGDSAVSIPYAQVADVSNFYPIGKVLRRRGGTRRLTTTASWGGATPKNILGMRRLVKSDGTSFFVLGAADDLGRYLDHRAESLIARNALGSNPSRDPWTLVQYKNFIYAMRRGAGGIFRVDGFTYAKAGITAPSTKHTLNPVGPGTLPTGTYRAVYTYGNQATGYESNPSPTSDPLTLSVSGNLIRHNGFVSPTDPFVDIVTVYRSLKDQDNGVFYRVGSTTIFSGPGFAVDDNLGNSALGTPVSFNNGLPPTNAFVGDIWNERLFVTDGKIVYFSEFLLTEGFGDENQINANPDDGFEVRSIRTFDDRLMIGKTGAIYYLTGTDRRSFAVHLLSDRHGIRAHGSVKSAEGQLFFFGSGKAIYRSDGTTVVEISDPKVKPLLEAIPDSEERYLTAGIFPRLGWYVLKMPPQPVLEFSSQQTYLVYNYREDTWTIFTTDLGGSLTGVLDDAIDESGESMLRIGNSTGDLFNFADETYSYDDKYAQTSIPCPGCITGIIGDGTGPAIGIGGANGYALACVGGVSYTIQANGSGVFTLCGVPSGDVNLVVYSEFDAAYRNVGTVTVPENNTVNVGTNNLNTLGAHPACV